MLKPSSQADTAVGGLPEQLNPTINTKCIRSNRLKITI